MLNIQNRAMVVSSAQYKDRLAPPQFRTRPDGRVEMRLKTTGRKELIRWVLSWMPDVKVLAPKSLHDRIAEKLRDGLRAQ